MKTKNSNTIVYQAQLAPTLMESYFICVKSRTCTHKVRKASEKKDNEEKIMKMMCRTRKLVEWHTIDVSMPYYTC